jgi:hypothetical protein
MAGAFSANSLFNQAHAAEFEHINLQKKLLSPKELAMDEDYWSVIQQGYTVSPSMINLNNGGVSPSPRIVQEAVERFNKMSNEGPSYYMWRILDQGREPLRYKLAQLAGCDPEEIAINRNATEALNTVIFGLNLKAGDEVVGSKFDYPNMINAWKQRAAREGIVYKQLDFKFPSESEDEMVRMYENAITPRTKIFHITHMVNWVGQIMPVKKLCALAKKHGIETRSFEDDEAVIKERASHPQIKRDLAEKPLHYAENSIRLLIKQNRPRPPQLTTSTWQDMMKLDHKAPLIELLKQPDARRIFLSQSNLEPKDLDKMIDRGHIGIQFDDY